MDVVRELLHFSLFAMLFCILTKLLLLSAASFNCVKDSLLKCEGETGVVPGIPNFHGNSPDLEFRDEDATSPREGQVMKTDDYAWSALPEVRVIGLLEKYMNKKGEEDEENPSSKRHSSGEVEINNEDDWEGVEKTQLETDFGAAVAFLGSSRNAGNLAGDVRLKMYGLHKIATQGPCFHPQPMQFKLSARAKWNAWQQLGNMSAEEAMAEYIHILSANIPSWAPSTTVGNRMS